jgi:hypothetical protein
MSTIIFQDDFEAEGADNTFDIGKWDCVGSRVSLQSSIVHSGSYAMKMQSGSGDPTISSIALNKDGKLTFDFYFYVASGGTTYECPLLQLFFGNDKSQYSVLGDVKKSSGTVKIGYYNSSFSFVQLAIITADTWHHLAIVVDVPNQTVSWSLNGSSVGTYDHIDQNTGNAIAANARMNDLLFGAGTGSYPAIYVDDLIVSQDGGTGLGCPKMMMHMMKMRK